MYASVKTIILTVIWQMPKVWFRLILLKALESPRRAFAVFISIVSLFLLSRLLLFAGCIRFKIVLDLGPLPTLRVRSSDKFPLLLTLTVNGEKNETIMKLELNRSDKNRSRDQLENSFNRCQNRVGPRTAEPVVPGERGSPNSVGAYTKKKGQ